MRRRALMIVILAASCVGVVPAFAATPTTLPTATPIPNDRTNFLGDRIVFKQDTIGYLQQKVFDANGNPAPDKEVPICIPHDTYLRGVGQTSNNEPLFVADCDWPQFFCSWPLCKTKDFKECGLITGHAGNTIPAGSPIKLSQTELGPNRTPPNRYGFTYGGLVVPFKFELTGKKEFKGSASVAPYMGYRLGFESSGIELAFPVVFAGVSNVSGTNTTTTAATATTPASSSTSTSDLAAFSYGTGVIGILKQTFQFGAVLGFDHAGSGQGFQYNDKPWLAVEIGYQFSQ